MHPALLILLCFVFGAVPCSWLVGLALGKDIREFGSRNAGATNLGRVCGWRWFFLGFVLDMAKGLVPVYFSGIELGVTGQWQPGTRGVLWWFACAIAAMVGHVFTPVLRFRGGKGVATALGVMLGMYPVMTCAGLGVLTVFLLVLWAKRYISLASLAGAFAAPVLTAAVLIIGVPAAAARSGVPTPPLSSPGVLRAGWPFVALVSVMAALVVWAHRKNIVRLRAGTESKVGTRSHS